MEVAKLADLPKHLDSETYRIGFADCFTQVLRILASHGQPTPEIDPHWYELAEKQHWSAIIRLVKEGTEPANGSKEFDVVMSYADTYSWRRFAMPLGFGVRVNDEIITRMPRKGMEVHRLDTLIYNPYWFRFKPA